MLSRSEQMILNHKLHPEKYKRKCNDEQKEIHRQISKNNWINNKDKMLAAARKAAETRRKRLELTLEERFWKRTEVENIEDPDSCWVWIAGKDADKGPDKTYGRVSLTRKSHERSHRFAWKLLYGSIPENLLVLHWCDKPLCVRPDHLFLGTYKDNSEDMYRKGRGVVGDKSWCSKLTEENVLEIKKAHKNGTYSTSYFAAKFKVKKTTILDIIKEKTWRHVLI